MATGTGAGADTNNAAGAPPAAGTGSFAVRMRDFHRWRDDIFNVIQEYQNWLEAQGLHEGVEDLRIYELMEAIRSDKLTVALVGEFSRGKTELINAIFFADYKQRLLPSAAGRTTMCPTELLYDEKQDPYIKLLPIETRRTSITIGEYKRTPVHWSTVHIHKLDATRDVAAAFAEIVRTKKVSLREAHELGLYQPAKKDQPISNSETIEIPVWRHAIINYPHPLLKQGLVVIDTPGLNALGTEPELTLNMLPQAQAVLFVLGADTGVTKTDLEVWNNHVCAATRRHAHARIAVLNKIDVLWDDLQPADAIRATIARQTNESAAILGLPADMVLPVSAQKGLIAKIKNEPLLAQRSGLAALEAKLAQDILPRKQQIMRDKILAEMGTRVQHTAQLIDSQLKSVTYQIAELKTLGSKTLDEIRATIAELRKEREKYDLELTSFQATRGLLAEQAKVLLSYLNLSEFDKLVRKSRKEMQATWTTAGIKRGMETVFAHIVAGMSKANGHAADIRKAVEHSYKRFHSEFGLPPLTPAPLSLATFNHLVQELEKEAELFRNSPAMTVTEQHFVIKKFYITLVSRARGVVEESNAHAKNWFRSIMAPVSQQIQAHKQSMDRRLENLRKAQEDLDNVSVKIADLEGTKRELDNQRTNIKLLMERLQRPAGDMGSPRH